MWRRKAEHPCHRRRRWQNLQVCTGKEGHARHRSGNRQDGSRHLQRVDAERWGVGDKQLRVGVGRRHKVSQHR